MHIIAFAGPSRPPGLDPAIDWRPPAAAGDLLALMAEHPDRVVLIDGYFDARPAPWHKEILMLIEQGIPVIGAASMGALRAAELAAFGMIGIGRIFEAYHAGRLTADDEVAVLHAPAALGWRPLTEPLVNVRANLLGAVRVRAIDAAAARLYLDTARRLNFRDRTWDAICAAPEFAHWLSAHRIDLKQRDAAQAIDFARTAPLPAPRARPTPRTSFLRRLADHRGVTLPPVVS